MSESNPPGLVNTWEGDIHAPTPFLLFALQTAFFRQHGCMANDANTKYTSRAAQMYREKIRQLGSAALTRHGESRGLRHMLLRRDRLEN